MDIGKLALALAALVIIGLIIYAIISFVMPGVFTYMGCALKTFLNPSGESSSLTACSDALAEEFKFTE